MGWIGAVHRLSDDCRLTVSQNMNISEYQSLIRNTHILRRDKHEIFLLHKQNLVVLAQKHCTCFLIYGLGYTAIFLNIAYTILFREIMSTSNLNVINIFRDVSRKSSLYLLDPILGGSNIHIQRTRQWRMNS